MQQFDLIVTGAGPAGLFCAIQAATGCRVLVLEKNRQPGAKLLITGTGQCNLTHAGDIRDFFSRYGDNGKFLKPALMSFDNDALSRYFTGHGIPLETEPEGKVFPKSRRASDILDALLADCTRQGVVLHTDEPVTEVLRGDDGFIVRTGREDYACRMLAVTTGGASYPSTGSTGDGYRFARALGHTVTEIAPALTPVYIKNFPFSGLSGMTFPSLPFTVWRGGKKLAEYCGDILITHRGLSGPGILDHSRSIYAGDEIRLSFAGQVRADEFAREFEKRISAGRAKQVKSIVSGHGIPERLARAVLAIAKIPEDTVCAHLPAEDRARLAALLTGFPLTVLEPGDFSVAMVTRGGVALKEVDPKTMASRRVPGLFFAGEVLDIDGDTGGYNLQAAFSTAFVAGRSAGDSCSRHGPGKTG